MQWDYAMFRGFLLLSTVQTKELVEWPGGSKIFGGRKLRCPQIGCIFSKYDMWYPYMKIN